MSESVGNLLRSRKRVSGAGVLVLLMIGVWMPCQAAESSQIASGGADSRAQNIFKTCAACHGERAQGKQALQAPALTALDAAYLERQLKQFATGGRGAHPKDTYGAQMAAAVSQLSDDGVLAELAVYIDSLPATRPAATLEGDLKQGRDFYMVCGSCHGPRGEGNAQLQAPALAGTDDWYLLRQIEHYREGIRGGDPEDNLGQQMQAMAQTLPNMTVARNVVVYIQSLVADQ